MKKIKELLLIFSLVLTITACAADTKGKTTSAAKNGVEVLYFHGPMRCRTCVAIEKATKELIDSQFANDVKSGKLVYKEVDLGTKEGEKIGDRYEIAFSSLLIVKKEGGKEKVINLTEDGFKYAVSDKAKLQSIISARLKELLK